MRLVQELFNSVMSSSHMADQVGQTLQLNSTNLATEIVLIYEPLELLMEMTLRVVPVESRPLSERLVLTNTAVKQTFPSLGVFP